MNRDFATAMRRAARSTLARDLGGATRIIQDALGGRMAPRHDAPHDETGRSSPDTAADQRTIDGEFEVVEPGGRPEGAPPPRASAEGPRRPRLPLGDVLKALRRGRASIRPAPEARVGGDAAPLPEGAAFLARSFACAAGARDYKLYVPASQSRAPRGLVVMLHGCRQNPDDFAAGTRMNVVAEEHGLLVAYPAQTGAANAASCWNWFNPGDQQRDSGEPAIIAGITREIVEEFGLRADRVFAAGLSAGGAMAAVLGAAYPELYSAVGIHSGLPYRAAHDVVSAFAAMRGDAAAGAAPGKSGGRVRTIVFHGSADRTVHPRNGERILAEAAGAAAQETSSGSAGGRAYTVHRVTGPGGAAAVEAWLVEGAGHAWAGGSAAGSFADPQGPDASREMVRFFLAEG